MNFNLLAFLLADSSGFGINLNILETNLINQLILIIGLFFIGNDALRAVLSQRQLDIVSNVQDSEKRLLDATMRLDEAKKQLAQTRVLINDIKAEAFLVQIKVLEADYVKTQMEILRKLNVATTTLLNREKSILVEIKQQISLLAIENVVNQIQAQQGSELEQVKYMDARIQMLSNVPQY